jgi:hypothetical protein
MPRDENPSGAGKRLDCCQARYEEAHSHSYATTRTHYMWKSLGILKNGWIAVRQGTRRRIVIPMQRQATPHGGNPAVFYWRSW